MTVYSGLITVVVVILEGSDRRPKDLLSTSDNPRLTVVLRNSHYSSQ